MSATLLSDLPQTVCDTLKPLMPALKTCKPHAGKFSLDELKKTGLPSPGLLVSVLGAKQGTSFAGGAKSFLLQMSAFVVTKDGLGTPRDVAAANICQVILSIVPDKDWGLNGIGQARDVNMHTLISAKTKDHGASLWAVTWNQPISFFQPTQLPLGVELYVANGDGNHNQVEG